MLVLFSLWQQVVWGGWGCWMQSFKKGHNEPVVVLPAEEEKWKFRCSWFDRTFPPFSTAIPRYITNWTLTCGAQRRAERQRDTCRLPVWHVWFLSSFSPRRLCRRWENVCTFRSHLFHFHRGGGRDCSCSWCVYTKLFDPLLFRGCVLHFKFPFLSMPSLCLAYLFHFTNWPDAFMCLNAQLELVCASEAMHQCCHWQNVHLL